MKYTFLMMLVITCISCSRHATTNVHPQYNVALKSLQHITNSQEMETIPASKAIEKLSKLYQKFSTPIDEKRDLVLRNKKSGDIYVFIFDAATTYQRYECDSTWKIKAGGILDR